MMPYRESDPNASMSNRRTLFAIACLGMLAFGIVLTTLGAVLPSVIERFGIDKAVAGSLFLLMTFGILLGSIVFGPIVDRNGYKGMLLLALALIVVGLEGIAFAPSMAWLRVAVSLIGFGGGIINGGTNALVADVSADGRTAGLSLLGVFFGVGVLDDHRHRWRPRAGAVTADRGHAVPGTETAPGLPTRRCEGPGARPRAVAHGPHAVSGER